MVNQRVKAEKFRLLHTNPGSFVIPNPVDAGTSKLLAAVGFKALATTSSGLATNLGRADGTVTLEQVIENTLDIDAATDLPVNVDMENGFAHEPEAAALAFIKAIEAGAAGASIEDTTGDSSNPFYDFDLAVKRVEATVQCVRALDVPFVLTARAETMLFGRRDLAETIRRLQAYEAAGADVLYASGLRNLDEIRQVLNAVKLPINVVASQLDPGITVSDLTRLGVKRISVGGAMSRVASSAFLAAANTLAETGTFDWFRDTTPTGEVRRLFKNVDDKLSLPALQPTT